jgi:hypothetical protein
MKKRENAIKQRRKNHARSMRLLISTSETTQMIMDNYKEKTPQAKDESDIKKIRAHPDL